MSLITAQSYLITEIGRKLPKLFLPYTEPNPPQGKVVPYNGPVPPVTVIDPLYRN